MGLINTSVPNLTQGVSQQPKNLRFSGQAETQVNALSSVIEGLTKRPNSRFLKELFSSPLHKDSFVDIIDRGSNDERFLVIIQPQYSSSGNGTIQMWKIDSDADTYNSVTVSNASKNYLQSSNPRNDIKIITVADTTFILNRSKTVEDSGQTKSAFPHEALIFVKQAARNKTYNISLGKVDTSAGTTGTTYSYTPLTDEAVKSNRILPVLRVGNNPNQDTDPISGQAYAAYGDLNGDGTADELFEKNGATTSDGIGEFNVGGYSIQSHLFGNVMRLRLKQGGVNKPFTGAHELSVSDDLNDQGLGLAYKEVSSITDLPAKAFRDFEIKVKGDTELGEDDYYVKFVTKNNEQFGNGSWVETTGFEAGGISGGRTFESDQGNLHYKINNSTFPLKLRPNGSNYEVVETDLSERTVGDDHTNPFPSFVSEKINDIFFFKNRLGVLTKDNVVMSEAGEFSNFFRTTTTSLLDSAIIDVSVSHPDVSDLQSAIAFQEKLLLMSPTSQFILRGNDILTPSTVNISPATQFTSDSKIDPLSLGGFVYFPFDRGEFQGIREFTIDDVSGTYDAFEITEHVPKYIPSDIREMVGSSAENIIVCTSSSNEKELYVYKFFRKNNEKLQSAWSKFTFRNKIIGCKFINSKLYMVSSDPYITSPSTNKTYLTEIPFESGISESNQDHSILLDNRFKPASSDISYNASTKLTTITNLKYDPKASGSDAGVVVYTEDGSSYGVTRTAANSCTVSGVDLSSETLFVGHEYEMEFEFSTHPLKQPSERGGRSISDFVHQVIRNVAIEYSDTGFFSIEVTPEYNDTFTYSFSPSRVGADFNIGNLALDSGMFRVPVHSQPEKVKIKIKSSSALPAKLLSAEFESFIAPRSRRYGSG